MKKCIFLALFSFLFFLQNKGCFDFFKKYCCCCFSQYQTSFKTGPNGLCIVHEGISPYDIYIELKDCNNNINNNDTIKTCNVIRIIGMEKKNEELSPENINLMKVNNEFIAVVQGV